MAKFCLYMDYILKGKLSIAGVLFRFVNNELLPDTDINPKKWLLDTTIDLNFSSLMSYSYMRSSKDTYSFSGIKNHLLSLVNKNEDPHAIQTAHYIKINLQLFNES